MWNELSEEDRRRRHAGLLLESRYNPQAMKALGTIAASGGDMDAALAWWSKQARFWPDRFGDALSESMNPLTPGQRLAELAASDDERIRCEVASNPSAPPEVLEQAALTVAPIVSAGLYAVSGNPSTDPGLLRKLATSKSWQVRQGVAGNPATPGETLARLGKDKRDSVRFWVAANPSCPTDVLVALLDDSYPGTRAQAAHNVGLPDSELARHAHGDLAASVASNPSIPKELLTVLASDPDADIRRSVARNPSAPREIVRQLEQDGDDSVRQAAKEMLEESH